MDLEKTPENDKTGHETTVGAGSGAGTVGHTRHGVSPIGTRGSDWLVEAEVFANLKQAKARIRLATSIEEKLAILAGNYAEYERELLDGALRQVLRSDFSPGNFQQGRVGIARRLMNLLSAARMYVDQVKSDLSEFDPTGRLKTLANGRMAAEYDTRFGYRVMEALRNVAQHQALPVQMVSYPHETRGEYLRIRVIPGLMVSHLASTDMKAPILEELKSKANRDVVQITPLVRDYLEGLGAVHKAVRKEMADDLAVAESFMTQTLADCAARWPGSFGCDVWEEEGEARTGFEVFKGLAEARRRASDNVGTFDGLSRLFVSGELDDPK